MSENTPKPRASIVRLDQIESVPCPCGHASRAFADVPGAACSVHRVVISSNARTHYHRAHTEAYYVLEGDGQIELDGTLSPAPVGTAILIPPGVRHRAVVPPGGRMTILNVVTPPFDPADEHFDD